MFEKKKKKSQTGMKVNPTHLYMMESKNHDLPPTCSHSFLLIY